MKVLIPILLLLAGAAIAWTFLSSAGDAARQDRAGDESARLAREIEELRNAIEELKSDRETLMRRVASMGEENWTLPTRSVLPSAGQAGSPSGSGAAATSTISPEAGGEISKILPSGFSYNDFATQVSFAVRESQTKQAEEKRKAVLDAQVSYMKEKLDEAAKKAGLDGSKTGLLGDILETNLRRRSEIRGTKPWWEYSTEEWNQMRAQMKESEKARNDQIGNLLAPDQLKKFREFERKRPGWLNPNPSFNPRGEDP